MRPLLGSTVALALLLGAGEARADVPQAPPVDAARASASAGSAASDVAVPAMTLAEAIAYAKAHAPEVRAAEARLKAQVAQSESVGAEWYPSVGATAQVFGATGNNWTGTFVGQRSFDLPRVGATRSNTLDMAPYASTIVAAGLNQPVYEFGRIAAKRAAMDSLVQAEQHRGRQDTLDLLFNVEEAFVAVLTAKALARSADGAVTRARAIRDQAAAKVKAGLVAHGAVARIEADLARAEAQAVRAEGGVRVAQSTLAAAIGSDRVAVDAREAPATREELPALGLAVERAKARSPRVLRVLAELEAEERRTKAIAAESRPTVYATASISVRGGGAPNSANTELTGRGILPYVPNYDVGLVLSWPIFDGVTSGREEAQRAREDLKRTELVVTERLEMAALRRAYLEVETARGALASLDRAITSARESYAQAEAGFAAGMTSNVDVASASLLVIDAESNQAVAAFQLARARAQLGRLLAEEPKK